MGGGAGGAGRGGASLVAQLVKNPPAMPETRVQSLGVEDLLKEEMATHSSILAVGQGNGRGIGPRALGLKDPLPPE